MEFATIDEGRAHKRVMRVDGEEVCHLWVIDYTMRVGAAHVRMAGIGDVYTNRQHRMKGYMRHLYTDTLTYMIEEGYDVSMLFGIPNFYTKFGYASSIPKVHFTIKTRDAEVAGADNADRLSGITARPIEARDMAAVVTLYNSKNASRTGTVVRDPETFKEFDKGTHWETKAETAVWVSEEGTVLGYAVWDRLPTLVNVAEIEVTNAELYPVILAAFAQQAIEKRSEKITIYAPPDHGFAQYAERFGVTWTIEYPRYSDCMMRIINQQPLMTKLTPVFQARSEDWHTGGIPDALRIKTELGITTLRLTDNMIEAQTGGATPHPVEGPQLEIPQDILIQLIMGYRSVSDALTAPNVRLETGSGVDHNVVSFLNALFPRQNAFVWKPDYF